MSEDAPLLRLSARPAEGEPVVEGRVSLAIGGRPLEIEIEAPAGPTTLEAVMPVFRGLTNLLVARAEARMEAQGKAISCRKGCGACCSQAVQISETEARSLAALVEALPEPRRSVVRDRFAAAEQRLEAAGMTRRIAAFPAADKDENVRFALDYFRLGMACPFLEEGSCSIHPVRPLNCREYLVTSPAEACARLNAEEVRTVPLEGSVCNSVIGLSRDATPYGWVLLVQALSFARAHPEPAPTRPGPAWIEAGFARLSGA